MKMKMKMGQLPRSRDQQERRGRHGDTEMPEEEEQTDHRGSEGGGIRGWKGELSPEKG
jgi:hypothetical protein